MNELYHDKAWKWTNRFLDLAHLIASWSKDPSTKVGAVAVGEGRQILSTGYNGFPRGVHDDIPARMERPTKYLYVVHAEANLVAHAARHGISLKGATVYTTHYPCAQCAALLINSGIAEVRVDVAGKTNMPGEHFDAAARMFYEAGVGAQHVEYTGGQDNDLQQPDNPS
jgi:dCMP deaminase